MLSQQCRFSLLPVPTSSAFAPSSTHAEEVRHPSAIWSAIYVMEHVMKKTKWRRRKFPSGISLE